MLKIWCMKLDTQLRSVRKLNLLFMRVLDRDDKGDDKGPPGDKKPPHGKGYGYGYGHDGGTIPPWLYPYLRGREGRTGRDGEKGAKGDKGERGPRGAVGEPGTTRGDVGERGMMGDQGAQVRTPANIYYCAFILQNYSLLALPTFLFSTHAGS